MVGLYTAQCCVAVVDDLVSH